MKAAAYRAFRPLLILLTAAVALVYPAVAFYPYDWTAVLPQINTARIAADGGIAFAAPGPGIARTAAAPGWIATAMRTHRFEVELRVRPASLDQTGPARILTLSADPARRNLTIGQAGDALIVRLRTPWHSPNGLPPTIVPRAFTSLDWIDIRVAVRPGELLVEVDAVPRARTALPDLPLQTWEESYRLALGNELTNNRPWLGDVSRAVVRVDGESVDYARPGQLESPSLLSRYRGRRPAVSLFWATTPRDLAVNLFGFVPIGILLGIHASRRGRRARLAAIGLIALISLGLELGQLGLVQRYSSIFDLILNTAGGALGIVLGQRLGRRLSGTANQSAP